MGKRIFWIFMLFIGASASAAIFYVQSESFALQAKKWVQLSVTRDLGVELNFDRLKIGVLPPSISLQNVDLKVLNKNNALGLGMDTVFSVASLGFNFRMFQAFSRGISLNKIFINDGNIQITLPDAKNERQRKEKISEMVHKPIQIYLGDDFFLSIRQVEIKNIKLHFSFSNNGSNNQIDIEKINQLAVTPSTEGTNILLSIENLTFKNSRIIESIKALRANIDLERSFIFVSSLDMQRKDAALHASGKIKGSLDSLDSARPDLDIILRSPLSEISDYEKSLSGLRGEIKASLKIVGTVKDIAAQAKISVSDFQYSSWAFEKIETSGTYANKSILLDSFNVSNTGGKISLKTKLDIPLPFQSGSKNFRLGFSKVKAQSFYGDLKKNINNLKMEIDGQVDAKIDFLDKGKISALTIRPDFNINELELNNQTYGKSRAYKKIISLSPFKLLGGISWKNNEVRVSDARLEFATGALDVRGTVSEANGFDLYGTTEHINLGAEAKEISSIPLSGEGSMNIRVHGPDDALFIDFDVKQKNAKFVNFDFGDLEGRITLDDKKSYINITGIDGTKNTAKYRVDGKVNIGDGDDIALNATFSESNPDDLFAIFAKQVEKISWLPRGMTGKVSGNIEVGGGYSKDLETLEIKSNLVGKNLIYKGEFVQALNAKAGVHRGTIYARDVEARKYDSIIRGEIDYALNDEIKYRVESDRAKLRGFDFISSIGLPVDGYLKFVSEGRGKWQHLESKTHIDIRNGFIRTRAIPPVDFRYETFSEKSNFHLKIGQQLDLIGVISSLPNGDSHAEVRVIDSEFDYLLCLINRKICTDQSATLNANLGGKFAWKGRDWIKMNGQFDVNKLLLAKSGFNLRSKNPIATRILQGQIDTGRIQIEGEDSQFNIQFKGGVDGTSLNSAIDGHVSMKVLEFVSPFIEEARGRLGLALKLKGASESGDIQGSMSFVDGFLRLNGLDAPVESLNGKILFDRTRAVPESLQGQLGGGTVQVGGGFDLYLDRAPKFGLDLYLSNNRLKFFPINYAEFSEAKLSLTGDRPPYLFSGTAKVKRVLMRNNFDIGNGQKGLQNARYLPEKISGAKSLYEIRIRAVADSGIEVDNDLLNAEFRGETTLLNNFEFPQIIARAELVKGKLLFRNTAFTLDHALIRAPNPEFFNPQFSVGGSATVENHKVNIFASGTMDKPKITLSSAPSLPQEDIISLLAFGFKGDETRRINPNDTSAITYSEVGSILLEQLRLSKNLQQKGVKISVAPSSRENDANIIRPSSASAPGNVSPKLYVQTQITKNLDAAFGSTVGSAQGQELDANLEYKVGKKASVNAVYEQEPTGLSGNELKSSYGADLKFRWGFK